MPIYIRKKNVKIFKIYQNCRNHVQFNSSLRKKGHFLFFHFHFTNKLIQKTKNENLLLFSVLFAKNTKKRKTKIYFRFTFFRFICNKYKKTKIYFRFRFFWFICKKYKKRKTKIYFRFSFYLQSKLILVFHFR